MSDKEFPNDKGLSKKAQENLRRYAELRMKRKLTQKLLVLRDGEEVIRIFNPEQIEPQEIDYEGNGEKTQKFDYTVMDPDTRAIEIFRTSITTSGDIDILLAEGHLLLKVRREGTGKFGTRYHVIPIRDS